MAGETFARPHDGFRFRFGGMKVNSAPDTLPYDKYAFAQNVRSVGDSSVETRPGQTRLFITSTGAPITDLRAYAALSTDDNPRVLARDNADAVWLDNGTKVGTLAGAGAGQGATLLPFRPNQSPNPYMYVSNGSDYQKFSAPDALNNVVQKNVGIKEPQTSPDAVLQPQQFTELVAPTGVWTPGGTASAWVSGNRSSDIVAASLPDPAAPTPSRFSVQVGHIAYAVGEIVMFQGTPPVTAIIEDVIAPLSIQMTVQAIYYFVGATGRCIIVPQGINVPSGNVADSKRTTQSGVAAPQFEFIASLRRGALIRVGAEVAYVWSVTSGPNQQIAIETSTVNTHAVGENLVGLPTIVVNGIPSASSVSAGVNIIGDQGNTESFQVTVGVGTLTTGSAGGGSLGTVIASPTTFLNGWGPNAHVGLTPNDTFGLDPNTTQPYTNPANAFDNNLSTFAFAVGEATNLPRNGCVWKFNTPASGPSGATLNILSEIPVSGTDGFQVGGGESALYYSLDGGTTWIQVYFSTVPRAKQWDRIPLAASQDYTKIQVMANMYPHNHMYHKVYEINITSPTVTPSIGASTGAYQDNDYIHVSLNVDNYLQLTEIKIQFDVSDGTFSTNYFYYSVRPSDLVQAAANTLTQLGAIQDILQQDSVNAFSGKTGLAISAPTVAGAGQWTEIWFPISALTRVGGDQSKSMANIVDIQILVNALATVNVKVSSIAFVGGSAPNVGDAGRPYLYRVRPRDSRTGAVGNPSPATRYGAAARRQQIQLFLPSAAYDAQIDTWDIERFGGSVPSWRFIGTAPSTAATFSDNYDDTAALAGESLDFDNFEPWPSVDLPLSATATQVAGFIAVVTIPSPTNALRFLPGNLVKIAGQNVYTLRTRPILLTGISYQFEFVENAGAASNVSVNIYEPAIARQFLPYMWGPDVNGTVFACGDPLRAGTLYFAKPNAADSAPDRYNIEIVQPSEPLLGGLVVDGLSFVASAERWWALYPQLDNPAQRYNFVQQPLSRGLAAPRGLCTDGVSIFWWAKDGIWSSTKGSLTDADLYSLFPHEGVPGVASTYGTPAVSHTINPPDYSRAGSFRLAYANYYLYATYLDAAGVYITLVYDTRRDAWCTDVYGQAVTAFYHPEQQVGTLVTLPSRYPEVMMADVLGQVHVQTVRVNDNGSPIHVMLGRAEFDGGDVRAPKQWGDVFLDAEVFTPTGIQVMLMSLGVQVGPTIAVPTTTARTRQPLGVGGVIVSDFLGSILTWVDDFTQQTLPTRLFIWHPSFDIQPAFTIAWATFGTSFGLEGYGHIREIVAAYVSTAPVTLTITPFDGQAPAPITLPSTGGQYQKVLFPVSANKGQLFAFKASSAAQFQFFLDDWEIRLGAWKRSGPYIPVKTFSGQIAASAPT